MSMHILKAGLKAQLETMQEKDITTRGEESRVNALVFLNMALEHCNKETTEAKMGTVGRESNRGIVYHLIACSVLCFNPGTARELEYLEEISGKLCR